jgi:hypothetical protein
MPIEQLDLFAASQNHVDELNSLMPQLCLFTVIYAQRARDLARSGQKDSARNWSRFFSGACICEILAKSGCVGETDLTELKSVLKSLHEECHPDDVPAWETDIEAIRGTLENIYALMLERRQPVFPFYSLSPARSHVLGGDDSHFRRLNPKEVVERCRNVAGESFSATVRN